MDVQKKREREKQMVSEMIHLYCRKKHSSRNNLPTFGGSAAIGRHLASGGSPPLCADCAALDAYARMRSDKCPFMENKTLCSNCKVHCYKPDMREKIRKVMRFSGPRMILYHPVATIRHVIATKTEKGRLEET